MSVSNGPRDGDVERLEKLRRVHMHRWHVDPVDEPELFFLLRLLDASDAALREAREEIARLHSAKEDMLSAPAERKRELRNG